MKLKRLLTGVLSAVMALSVCAMPALADEVKTSTSTINTETKGSITIYKYAQTDAEKKETAPDSTGEVTNDTIHGTALPNAVFTLYRVKNTKDLMEYYAGIQDGTITEAKVEDYFTEGVTSLTEANLLDAYKSEVDKNATTEVGKIESKTTGDNGGAYFGNLPVGLYLLIETKTPESVTVPAKPFLVSVPMTRVGTTGKDTQWLYDVTVYPKNSTVQGTVTLAKKGYDGKTTVDLAGVKFTLWKYDESIKAYKQSGTEIVTGPDGTVEIENLVKGRYVLQETGYTTGNDKGYILNTTGIYAFSIDKNGKVAENKDTTFPGITKSGEKPNIVQNGDGFELSNDSGATITITNYKPVFEKNVTKRDPTVTGENTNHDADYGIDEDVPYTLTIKVPENVAKLQNFKVTDTALASQLKQNPNSIVVKGIAKGEDATENKLKPNVDYTASVTEIGKNSVMLVDFKSNKMTKIADYAGGTITITYTAKLQKDAVIANAGNVNTADLIYSRTTNTSSNESVDGNEPYQIEDKSVVYSFELNIEKTAQGGTLDKQKLSDVTFDLYKKADAGDRANTQGADWYFRGNKCDFVSGSTATSLGLTKDSNEVWLKVATLKTVDGVDRVPGLPAGEYKLVETQTVDGYNLLSEPVDAKLNLEYATEWNTTVTYENGKEIKRTDNKTTYTYKDEKKTAVPGTTLKIVNRAGFTLPVTGGFGTLLFSGIGVLLVLAGVCVLFSMKKKNNRT